jgi:hypothetical protein
MRRDGSSVFLAWASRVVFAAVLALSLASNAHAQASGSQQTPDSARYLISKDVGAERWAISYNLNDGTVTGNVFKTDGSPPSFIWCKITGEVPAANPPDNQYTLDCYGSDACAAAPCTPGGWNLIVSGLQIGGDFLLPPQTASTYSGNVQPIFTQSCATSLACHVAGGAAPVDLAAGESYAKIFKILSTEAPSQFYIAPFDNVGSYLLNKVDGTATPAMPLTGGPLPPEQIDAIRTWILEGAANN